MSRVFIAKMFHPLREDGFPIAVRFVARGNEHERGVISEIAKDALGFGIKLFLHQPATEKSFHMPRSTCR